MKKASISLLFFLAVLILFPSQAWAVDYSITNVQINAYLQENGNVHVEEIHTYEFSGEFNGITREIVPKSGTEITHFRAAEKGYPLQIERENDLYKIHRKGQDESVTVTLQYTIKKGIEVYQDVAQFYWPFFDSRNPSTYENLSIVIYPPESTHPVVAFGYDQAFATETIQVDGSILFQLGEVPSGTNGDIRVAYDANLFTAASPTIHQRMKDTLIQEQHSLIVQEQERAERKETLVTIAKIGLPTFTLFVLLLMFRAWLDRRARYRAIEQNGSSIQGVPEQIISLPATIYYTNSKYLPPEAMAAALLDLVRQGYVKKTGEASFQVIHTQGALAHEQIVLKWLFEIIGQNGEFSFDDLKAYTKNKKNHSQYHSFLSQWQQAIKQELQEHSLYEEKKGYRLLVGLSSLLVLPFLILFPLHDLFGAFFAALALFITVTVYAFSYHPKTVEGTQLSYEWKLFKQQFTDISIAQWEAWSDDERMRAYIYGLGINQKKLHKKNEELVAAFTPPTTSGVNHPYPTSDVASFAYIGPLASSSFHAANQSAASSSHGGGSGGGTGGGGGGSGAF
ncbi:DUF2207 domain-containing protein [Caldalkalibacillus mannanilyticus]|uniref:DUF2207 domain-containing protein n=1 Tax=Caldalkalibacillus mannanilyticus TaxID=1418 RepID=UPI00046A5448|nr:DUF2207 domain-containing protein [Caldalkalibacillus mannanilyticus]